jgi:hypothetical protein
MDPLFSQDMFILGITAEVHKATHVYYLLVYGTGHQKMMVGWLEKNKK